MLKRKIIWVAIIWVTVLEGSADVLRLSLVVEEKGEGVEEITSADGERTLFVKKEAIVGDADVETATLVPGAADQIAVLLTKKGGEKLKKATGAMRKGVDRMAIIIDDKLIIAPTVQAELSRNFVVSGLDDLNLGELDNLARRMSGRPLRPEGDEPVLPEVEEIKTVPYTDEEYQEIKARRESVGLYYLEKIPSEEELNKALRKGMSFDEVVRIYGKPSGPPLKEEDGTERRHYLIAPELGPINPKREMVPVGFSVIYNEGRLVSWEMAENVQWRTEKNVNPKQEEAGRRNLVAEMPEIDLFSEELDLISFYEKVKIPNPKQNLTKQDLIDLLGIVFQMYGTVFQSLVITGEEGEEHSFDPDCDLLKTLAHNFPEVKKLVAEKKGKRILLKDLYESLSVYGSEEKPLPVRDGDSEKEE